MGVPRLYPFVVVVRVECRILCSVVWACNLSDTLGDGSYD